MNDTYCTCIYIYIYTQLRMYSVLYALGEIGANRKEKKKDKLHLNILYEIWRRVVHMARIGSILYINIVDGSFEVSNKFKIPSEADNALVLQRRVLFYCYFVCCYRCSA